jgi:hypothetical protein
MSNSITRGEFVRELASQGGHLDVNDLDPDLKKDLDAAGIDAADLKRIAGADGQIRGAKEMKALFHALDGIENAGPTTGFDIARRATDGTTRPTLAGEIYEQLKAEVEANRQAASSQGIVHLGMRQPSEREVRALEAVTPDAAGGVHSIAAYASDGKVTYSGQTHDLGTDVGLASFREALVSGSHLVPADRADRLVQLLRGKDAQTRDEIAQLALSLHRIGP